MEQSFSFDTDEKLRINSWGKKIAAFTGKPPSAVMGKKYYEVIPGVFANAEEAVAVVLKENRPLTVKEYCVNCLVKADIRIDPKKGTNGKVRGAKIAITPSQTCSASEERQGMQRLVDIGRTATTLAHGVRNPLNAIKGAVIYIREKYADEPVLVEFTRIMEEEISRLDNFVSRFLSTSVADAELSEIDVNSLLKKIEIFTSLQTRVRNIRTVYEYGDVSSVTINSFQLEQAMLNVINNAIEAMHSGGLLVVKTRDEDCSGIDFAIIEISDTGPGMAKGGIDGLCTTSNDRGRGFGLFITREILQYYGGHLEIKSSRSTGTTVRLYFPASGQGK